MLDYCSLTKVTCTKEIQIFKDQTSVGNASFAAKFMKFRSPENLYK